MLVQVREALRGGESLAQAMQDHASWFDPTEIAMVDAAQHGGTLPEVLRSLTERHERSDELTSKLAGALTYPAIVTLIGLGVVVFLSVRTLPQLVQILTDAGIPTPALTERVMAFGSFLYHWWPAIGVGLLVLILMAAVLRALALGAGSSRRAGCGPSRRMCCGGWPWRGSRSSSPSWCGRACRSWSPARDRSDERLGSRFGGA